MASCVVSENVTALALDKIRYAELIARLDPVGSAMRVAMIRTLAEQIAFSNGQLVALEGDTRAAADRVYEAELTAATGEHPVVERPPTAEIEVRVSLAGAGLEANGPHIRMPSIHPDAPY